MTALASALVPATSKSLAQMIAPTAFSQSLIDLVAPKAFSKSFADLVSTPTLAKSLAGVISTPKFSQSLADLISTPTLSKSLIDMVAPKAFSQSFADLITIPTLSKSLADLAEGAVPRGAVSEVEPVSPLGLPDAPARLLLVAYLTLLLGMVLWQQSLDHPEAAQVIAQARDAFGLAFFLAYIAVHGRAPRG